MRRAFAKPSCGHQQAGFTYLALLIAIAVLGIGLTAASEVWVTSARRQKMVELDWVGEQFVLAVGSYYESSPGSVKVYPLQLEELLEDRRYLSMRRHLRKVYLNPFTGKTDWEIVRNPDGRIQGVRVVMQSAGSRIVREYVHQPMVSVAIAP